MSAGSTRARQRRGVTAFPVAKELVLLSPEGETAHALNESAALIWQLCDGRHTALEIFAKLHQSHDGDPVTMLAEVTEALLRFHQLALVEFTGTASSDVTAAAIGANGEPRIRFVFGIEDLPYFHWQIAILFESLVGQLPPGWDITVVVCNDHQPLSADLGHIIEVYGVNVLTGDNHAFSHKIDFSAHEGGYVALNRVEALKVIAPHVDPDDIVCLMDTDIFLCGNLQPDVFPTGNALMSNGILQDRLFLGRGSEKEGIDLQKLLATVGCDRELKRGAVTVFMTGATVNQETVVQGCFRFAQAIYLLAKTMGIPEQTVWMSEMACFAMSLTANGIDYELLDAPQFAVPEPERATVPDGSFFHYYVDVNDQGGAPFSGSDWNKQMFGACNFLDEDIESFREAARGQVAQRFFDIAIASRKRLRAVPQSPAIGGVAVAAGA